jgi:hypothetical protein
MDVLSEIHLVLANDIDKASNSMFEEAGISDKQELRRNGSEAEGLT